MFWSLCAWEDKEKETTSFERGDSDKILEKAEIHQNERKFSFSFVTDINFLKW